MTVKLSLVSDFGFHKSFSTLHLPTPTFERDLLLEDFRLGLRPTCNTHSHGPNKRTRLHRRYLWPIVYLWNGPRGPPSTGLCKDFRTSRPVPRRGQKVYERLRSPRSFDTTLTADGKTRTTKSHLRSARRHLDEYRLWLCRSVSRFLGVRSDSCLPWQSFPDSRH